jgi:EAL domain-containing protein (putative c-di-GMP-specific phosphodiesterase class I)
MGTPTHKLDRKNFPRGAKIFREGAPGTSAYLIERGVVQISSLREGKKYELARLTRGDLFGEMALIDDNVRSATATALEESEMVVISREYLKSKVDHADAMIKLLLNVLLDRFRTTQKRFLGQTVSSKPKNKNIGSEGPLFQDERKQVVSDLIFKKELEQAIEQHEFELHYQPIVQIDNQAIAGFEALIRWQHPVRGIVFPNDFIGFAEETGLIVPIGKWVFEEACRSLQSIHSIIAPKGDMPRPVMCINISPWQLYEPDFVTFIPALLKNMKIDPTYLHLEITETILMENPDLANYTLGQLKDMGLKLVIDDFGTGYSSLSYLHRFPLQYMKIDRSFIATMIENQGSMEIVRAVAGLAHNLGMRTVAEGIETREQLKWLRDLKTDYGQGYLFSKPVPLSSIFEMIAEKTENDWHCQ